VGDRFLRAAQAGDNIMVPIITHLCRFLRAAQAGYSMVPIIIHLCRFLRAAQAGYSMVPIIIHLCRFLPAKLFYGACEMSPPCGLLLFACCSSRSGCGANRHPKMHVRVHVPSIMHKSIRFDLILIGCARVQTGDYKYVENAISAYRALGQLGLMEKGQIYDGVHTSNVTDVNRMKWSYNNGMALGALTGLYTSTNDIQVFPAHSLLAMSPPAWLHKLSNNQPASQLIN
jgi:hypothetical protein